ncbi:MAG: hypothetical protein QOE31_776 [Solirubrobacteraceae bacterium]|nr:hypothetical protein [Solirubrobacteraceae bacterium]
MALLLKDRDATPQVAAEPPRGDAPLRAPDFACHACGGAMQAGQDWCLECGTAAPGRLGARPGWRAAFTVVSLTMLLVVGALVASYAALTSDAERKAAAPSAGDGAPIAAPGPAVAQAPPVTPGATGPNTTVPPAGSTPGTTPGTIPGITPGTIPGITPGSKPGATVPIIPTTPPAPVTNTPVTPPAVTPPPAATTPPPPPPPAAAVAKPQIIKLQAGAAKTYDPGKRAGAEYGPAKYAIDRSAKTVWDVTVPVDGKPIGAGLMIDLGKPYALRAIQLATPTKGFRVELYGAVSAKEIPEDILDKRWEHVTDIRSVTDGKLVSLLHKSKTKFQLLLLYVTDPAEPADPRAAIGDVKVAGTP